MSKRHRWRIDTNSLSRYCAGFTLIELLVVMSIIVSLSAILAVALPRVRRKAQIDAAKGDVDQVRVGVASFQAEWSAMPPSGISALVGALREGTRRGAAHARLISSRLRQVPGLKLGSDVEATSHEVPVTPFAGLPAVTDPLTKQTRTKQFGACRIEDEWIVFSSVGEGSLTNCRRGRFGTVAAAHSGGVDVLMYYYVDPWGTPYAYTVSEDYGKSGTDQMLSLTGFIGRLAEGQAEQGSFENEGSFQIISAGPNRRFYSINPDTGEPVYPDDDDDDIRNW